MTRIGSAVRSCTNSYHCPLGFRIYQACPVYRCNTCAKLCLLSPINCAADIPYVASGSKNRIVGSMSGTLIHLLSHLGAMHSWSGQLCLVLPIAISVGLSPPIALAQIRKAWRSSDCIGGLPRILIRWRTAEPHGMKKGYAHHRPSSSVLSHGWWCISCVRTGRSNLKNPEGGALKSRWGDFFHPPFHGGSSKSSRASFPAMSLDWWCKSSSGREDVTS